MACRGTLVPARLSQTWGAASTPLAFFPSPFLLGVLCHDGWSPALPSHPWEQSSPGPDARASMQCWEDPRAKGEPPAVWGRGEPAQQCPTEQQTSPGGSEPGTWPGAVDIFSPNASPFLFAFPSSCRRPSQKAEAGSCQHGAGPQGPLLSHHPRECHWVGCSSKWLSFCPPARPSEDASPL